MDDVLDVLEAQIQGRINRHRQLVSRTQTLYELHAPETRDRVHPLFNRTLVQIRAVTAAKKALDEAYMAICRLKATSVPGALGALLRGEATTASLPLKNRACGLPVAFLPLLRGAYCACPRATLGRPSNLPATNFFVGKLEGRFI